MGEYLVLCVDHLFTPESLPLLQGQEVVEFPGKSSSSGTVDPFASVIASKENKEQGVADEGEPFLESVECRICQEEDSVKNLEIPCACSGTLKMSDINSRITEWAGKTLEDARWNGFRRRTRTKYKRKRIG